MRGENMAAAAKQGRPHGMLSIIGLEDAKLEAICTEARGKLAPGTVCQLANYLFPAGRVVSGHKDALEEVGLEAHSSPLCCLWTCLDVRVGAAEKEANIGHLCACCPRAPMCTILKTASVTRAVAGGMVVTRRTMQQTLQWRGGNNLSWAWSDTPLTEHQQELGCSWSRGSLAHHKHGSQVAPVQALVHEPCLSCRVHSTLLVAPHSLGTKHAVRLLQAHAGGT